MQKIPTFKYASILIFLIFVHSLVLTVHHMHALKGPTLKNVNVYQVFPHLTLTLHPSMLLFLMLESTWRVCGECFTSWDLFLWIYIGSGTVNCSQWVLWGAEERRAQFVSKPPHSVWGSVMENWGTVLLPTWDLFTLWPLHLKFSFPPSLIQWVIMVVTYPAWYPYILWFTIEQS